MKKNWIIAMVLACLVSVMAAITVFADETAPAAQWKSDNNGWQYILEKGSPAKNCWKQIEGHWYHFDREGYMATGWMKIGGYRYFFWDSGDLAVGWSYDDEYDKWYNFNEDGTSKKGWFQDGDGSWYWFSNYGEMARNGYKTVDGQRYYFFEDGQMAANQYVGLYYMDSNGQRDKRYDIALEGKLKESSVSSDTRIEISDALKDIPRGWMKHMTEQGWQIIYYPDREYFSAPNTEGSRYFIFHKVDTTYRKIKFCKPEALTLALGEYIGYASGSSESGSPFATEFTQNSGNVDDFIDVPDYFNNDLQFYFGKMVEAYFDHETKTLMETDSPRLCKKLQEILYQYDILPVDSSPHGTT